MDPSRRHSAPARSIPARALATRAASRARPASQASPASPASSSPATASPSTSTPAWARRPHSRASAAAATPPRPGGSATPRTPLRTAAPLDSPGDSFTLDSPADTPERSPPSHPIVERVLACRRGQVLDLEGLDRDEARDLYKTKRMPTSAWKLLGAPEQQPPITEVRLPAAPARHDLAMGLDGLNHLRELRALYLPAPHAGRKVPLHRLLHPAGQVRIFLTLPQTESHTVYLAPGQGLQVARPESPGLAKHQLSTVPETGALPLPGQTLPGWPYLRRTPGADSPVRPTGHPTLHLVMCRLLRQLLSDGLATHSVRQQAAPPRQDRDGASPTWTLSAQGERIRQAWRSLSSREADLPGLLAGVEAALDATPLSDAGAGLPRRVPFRYDYAATPLSLQRNLGPVIPALCRHLAVQPPCALVGIGAVGPVLAGLLPSMAKDEARYLALCGNEQVLGLILRRRTGNEASVVCYDPCLPDTHVRMVCADTTQLQALDLAQMLVPASPARPFGAAGSVAALYDLRQLRGHASAGLAAGTGPPPLGAPAGAALPPGHWLSPQLLAIAMHFGPPAAVARSLHAMAARSPALPWQSLTHPVQSGGGLPLLQGAICTDRIHLVAAGLGAMASLPDFEGRAAQCARVLSGPSPRADALHLALLHSPQAAGLLARYLLTTPAALVPPSARPALLGRADHAAPGLLHALLSQPTCPALPEALHAFCYEVAASEALPVAARLRLLGVSAPRPSAMEEGLRRGHALQLIAMACALHEAPMAPEAREALLTPLRGVLLALPAALDLRLPGAEDWIGRLLARLGRPGTAAEVSVRLRLAWSQFAAAPDWAETPAVQALLASPGLRVAGTSHADEDFQRAGLRAWQADDSRRLVLCFARSERNTVLKDLAGWRLMPGTRRLPLQPPMSSPLLYLLPAQLLSPLARAADGQAPESGSGSAEGSTPEGKWASLPR